MFFDLGLDYNRAIVTCGNAITRTIPSSNRFSPCIPLFFTEKLEIYCVNAVVKRGRFRSDTFGEVNLQFIEQIGKKIPVNRIPDIFFE